MMKKINEAYDVLGNEEKRKTYNAELEAKREQEEFERQSTQVFQGYNGNMQYQNDNYANNVYNNASYSNSNGNNQNANYNYEKERLKYEKNYKQKN